MSEQLGLFGPEPESPAPAPVGPAPVPPVDAEAAERLPAALRLGTSSWTFPGWAGLVYDHQVSQSVLAARGLEAYARHPLLRTVGLDRTFYRPMPAADLRALADAVPDDFRFLVKAVRTLTSPTDPAEPRIRGPNPHFLDARYATEVVVGPVVEGLGAKAGPLLFQFSPIPPNLVGGRDAFLDRLHRFLEALPAGLLYSVELRTPAFLTDRYVQLLEDLGVAHSFVVHPAMTPLAEQLRRIRPFEQQALVVRWMLHAGLRYEAARDRYHPFDRIVDEDLDSRELIAGAALDALLAERGVFVVVNNKAEGSAPLSVFRLAQRILHWESQRPPSTEARGPTESPAVTLRWLVRLFRRSGVRYQAVGGLAARAWGAERPLRDLDFYLPRPDLEALLPELDALVERPLGPHVDTHWRVDFVRLVHHGTPVELGVAEGAEFRDAASGDWVPQGVDFDGSVELEVMGVRVACMPQAQLRDYKRRLGRPVDLEDLAQLDAAASAG